MMRFSQAFRLVWIDGRLEVAGTLRRSDLTAAFGVSTAQASLDLRAYQERFPDLIAYDKSAKVYIRRGDRCAFRPESRAAARRAQETVAAEMRRHDGECFA